MIGQGCMSFALLRRPHLVCRRIRCRRRTRLRSSWAGFLFRGCFGLRIVPSVIYKRSSAAKSSTKDRKTGGFTYFVKKTENTDFGIRIALNKQARTNVDPDFPLQPRFKRSLIQKASNEKCWRRCDRRTQYKDECFVTSVRGSSHSCFTAA